MQRFPDLLRTATIAAIAFASGFLIRETIASFSSVALVQARLASIELGLKRLDDAKESPPFVFCANASASPAAPPEKAPVALLTARILPYPPENVGRVLLYESFHRETVDGRERVIFREYRDGSFVSTSVPPSEIRWNVAVSTQ